MFWIMDARSPTARQRRSSRIRKSSKPISARHEATMLEVKDIHVYYGAIHALKGISLSVKEGDIVTLIGANGAGKSTTLRALSGLLKLNKGKVSFQGKEIGSSASHRIVKAGLSHCPEGR